MNIFKIKKLTLLRRISNLESKLSCFFTKLICFKLLIATAFTFVIFMTLVQLPLPAKERRGATVVVTMADGSLVKGELLVVKADALLIYDRDSGLGKSLDLQHVVKLKVIRESKFLLGMIFGLGVGMGLTSYSIKKEDRAGLFYGLGSMLLTPLTGLCGGILAAIASKDKKLSLAEKPSQAIQENLKRLKRYSREQDYEKPVETIFAEITASTSKTKAQSPRAPQPWRRHRFGLLWSPGYQCISGSGDFSPTIATFRFVNIASSKDMGAYPYQPFSESFSSGRLRAVQLRLEYEWTPHFSPSIEFIASGKLRSEARMDLSYYSSDYAREYDSRFSFNNEYSYNSLLLGFNWKSLSPSSARKNIFELGIAAGPALAQVNLNCGHSLLPNPPNKSRVLTWTCKVHAAYDHFYTDNFSLGVFISYQYLRASFPAATIFYEKQEFWSGDHDQRDFFTRPTEFTIPRHNMQLGGMAYGIRVGLRF